MTLSQQIITIAICALGTMAARFLPFIVFSSQKPTPKYIQYLGKALPAAIFGMLMIYCLRNVDVFSGSHGLPELISIGAVTAVHLYKRNMMLSISAGTVCYMLLVNFVF